MCRYVYGHMSTELHYPGFGQDVFGESPGCLKTYNVGPGALLTMKPQDVVLRGGKLARFGGFNVHLHFGYVGPVPDRMFASGTE